MHKHIAGCENLTFLTANGSGLEAILVLGHDKYTCLLIDYRLIVYWIILYSNRLFLAIRMPCHIN